MKLHLSGSLMKRINFPWCVTSVGGYFLDEDGGSLNTGSDCGCNNQSSVIQIEFSWIDFGESWSGISAKCLETRFVIYFFIGKVSNIWRETTAMQLISTELSSWDANRASDSKSFLRRGTKQIFGYTKKCVKCVVFRKCISDDFALMPLMLSF